MSPPARPRVWAVVPAAGTGSRMGHATPKQYLELGGRPIVARAVQRVASDPRVHGVVVALREDDAHWSAARPRLHCALWTVVGGDTRQASVLAALDWLVGAGESHDWVAVHDAARPCLRPDDLRVLLDVALADAVGAVLAMPVRDTMKRADPEGRVAQTVSRDHLWHALTPQVFRLGQLRAALRSAEDAGRTVTDEAQAMEDAGLAARLVVGHADNLKITHPADMALGEQILAAQGADD